MNTLIKNRIKKIEKELFKKYMMEIKENRL
jgi:hypothetical protein